jgi:hypothetical protein
MGRERHTETAVSGLNLKASTLTTTKARGAVAAMDAVDAMDAVGAVGAVLDAFLCLFEPDRHERT